MSVVAIELISRVYQTPRLPPNCLFYKPPLIVDGEIWMECRISSK